MIVRPYGSWNSPITSDLVVRDAIRLDQVVLDGDTIYWTESQPQKQGRTFIYRAGRGGESELVTPDDVNFFNVRTRVHEYGGGAFAVQDGTVLFSNFSDQRLYRQAGGQTPRAITPAPAAATRPDTPMPAALRYADGVFDRRRGRLICVREDHTSTGQVINAIVSIDLSGSQPPDVLVSGNDFYSSPRLSPDGGRLVWLTWNNPDMPWVATEVWVGEVQAGGTVVNARRVAGGPDEALCQPEWSPDGDLYFVSDRGSGWWNLHRERGGSIEPMAPMDAEFGRPHWNFGASTYAFESPHSIICCFVRDGIWHMARLDTRTKHLDPVPTPFTDIWQLRAGPGRVVFLGGTATDAVAVIDMDLATGAYRVVRPSITSADEIRPCISAPEPITFPTASGEVAHAFFYPPFSPTFRAPEGEKAPVLVKSHGGPTSSASSTLSLGIQYWTSRGIGVLDVDYRGSTGHGRPYRLKLERQWGIVDV